MTYAVFGAGDIGCTVGVALAASGASVTLIGRDSPTGRALHASAANAGAVVIHERSRWECRLSPKQCAAAFTTDTARLAEASVIFVATKRSQNEAAARAIGLHARRGCTIVLLQNGVGTAEDLRARLPAGAKELLLVECVVSMNAVREVGGGGGVRFHWTSPRDASNPAFVLAAAGAAVAAVMDGAGLLAGTTDRVDEVAHAKLIINCGMNAVLAVYRAAGIAYDPAGVAQFVRLFRLPNPAVWRATRPSSLSVNLRRRRELGESTRRLVTQLLLAERARSSMWSDVRHRRETEVRHLNGHVARLGARHGVPTPINSRLLSLVCAAERAASGHPGIGAAAMAGNEPPEAGGLARSIVVNALGACALAGAAVAVAVRLGVLQAPGR